MPLSGSIQIWGQTAAEWLADDPILKLNQPGLETDTRKVKYGDGVSAWSALSYSGSGGQVDTITGVPNRISVDSSDPANPIIDIDSGYDAVIRQEFIQLACSDETTAITTGTAKVTFRMPYALTLTSVRASLSTASSSGTPTVDINKKGLTVLSTKLTIDANEKTSVSAVVPAVISDTSLTDDSEITIDIDVAGTGAKGLKVTLIGTR